MASLSLFRSRILTGSPPRGSRPCQQKPGACSSRLPGKCSAEPGRVNIAPSRGARRHRQTPPPQLPGSSAFDNTCTCFPSLSVCRTSRTPPFLLDWCYHTSDVFFCQSVSPEKQGKYNLPFAYSGWYDTVLPGGTEWVSQVLPPITLWSPTTVSPPRMVALA